MSTTHLFYRHHALIFGFTFISTPQLRNSWTACCQKKSVFIKRMYSALITRSQFLFLPADRSRGHFQLCPECDSTFWMSTQEVMQTYSQALTSKCLSLHLAPLPTPIHPAPALSPSLPPHPNTRDTDPVSNWPRKTVCGGRGRNSEASQTGLRLRFFACGGEESRHMPLYAWIKVHYINIHSFLQNIYRNIKRSFII